MQGDNSKTEKVNQILQVEQIKLQREQLALAKKRDTALVTIKGERGDDGSDGTDGQDGKDGSDGKDGVNPDPKKIEKKVLDVVTAELPDIVISEVAPILASISREKTDLEAIRGQLEALLADGNERIAEAIKTAEGKIKDIKPTRGVHFGGTVHQRMTAFSFNDSSNRTASTYLKVGSSTMNSNEGVPMIRPGSITGVAGGCQITGHSVTGDLALEVYKNGSLVYTCTATSITGDGYFVVKGTQAAGLDTFVAGDKLAVKTNLAGTYTYDDMMGVVEIEVTD